MEICHQILEQIKKYDTIIIHRHMRADPDALGSQVGLKELLQYNFPDKKIKVVGYDLPTLTWLAKMDEVEDQEFEGALAIICDTANRPRIDDKRYEQAAFTIKIDHHPNVTPYGKICYVDTTAASASEIMAEFSFDETTPFEMNRDAANVIYAGIIGDTGRFLYPSTTSKTFALVSKLIQHDVDLAGIADKMITKPLNVNRMTGYIYEHLEIYSKGMASVVLTKEVLERFQATDQLASLVVSVPGTVEGILAWSMYVEQEDGTFRGHLRSKGPTVNHIAQAFGGGGHRLACGIPSVTKSQILEVDAELKEAVSNFKKN